MSEVLCLGLGQSCVRVRLSLDLGLSHCGTCLSMRHCSGVAGLGVIEDRLGERQAWSVEIINVLELIARCECMRWCGWKVCCGKGASRVASDRVLFGFNAKLGVLEGALCVRCVLCFLHGAE